MYHHLLETITRENAIVCILLLTFRSIFFIFIPRPPVLADSKILGLSSVPR